MKRRDFMALVGVAIFQGASPQLGAQGRRRVHVGYLNGATPTAEGGSHTGSLEILKEGLHQLGWRERETFDMEARFANGDSSLIPRLAAELVARRPDVIVATGSSETKALHAATRDIPIVFLQIPDPISLGVVDSIARPGRNITGFSFGPQTVWGKRLEILAELLGRQPHRLAWLGNPANPGAAFNWTDTKDAAGKLGADLIRVEVSKPDELDGAFDALGDRDALLVGWDFLLYSLRKRIAELALQRRLPAIYEYRGHVVEGGLLSYGADVRDNYRRAAVYVDRILKGARPADLPVDQASRFELVINLKAAKGLGITVPPALLARADEVIE
jgi:putative tryptophan/tyrosine transport system substrate-binding protein